MSEFACDTRRGLAVTGKNFLPSDEPLPSIQTAVAAPAKRKSSKKKWRFSQHDRRAVEELAKRCNVSPVVAQLLLQRNLTKTEDVQGFLESKLTSLRPPEELPGLTAACQRIMRGVREREEIVIYGDYDADGMTATAILYLCLKRLGANVSYHLPNRMEEGYGLHVESIEKLAERGKKLVITVDCGVASIEPARRAKELGSR